MKKIVALLMVAVMLTLVVAPVAEAKGSGRGGIMGLISGCCFGVRAAGDYNEGKEIHWREWVMLVPYVNIVFAIITGVEGYDGMTSADYAEKYGASYY